MCQCLQCGHLIACLLRSCLSTLFVGMGMSELQQDASRERDEDVAALVQALPQLRVLGLENYAKKATDAGLQCKTLPSLHGFSAVCVIDSLGYMVQKHSVRGALHGSSCGLQQPK
jgi:hypothetical protein